MAMAQFAPAFLGARHDQMFPTLAPADIDRLARFGEARSYPAGDRIMRALILRRDCLLESAASGPIIIGPNEHADVLRLQNFLTRNGQPHRALDSNTDSCATTLIERFHVDRHHLPIVLCPNGKLLRNPTENELARRIGLLRPIDAAKIYDVAIVGAGPAGLAAAVYAASEGLSVIVLD